MRPTRNGALLPSGHQALIPWPQAARADSGSWSLPADPRIAITSPALAGIAEVLAAHLRTASLGALAPRLDPIGGDIALAIDPALPAEGHVLEIDATGARIAGGSPAGVAWGAASLVQALRVDHRDRILPHLRIVDQPRFAYRGLMVDVARFPHSLTTLKQLVVLCWFYKVRFLQLHLCDVESFAFPSTAFPDLATPGRHLPLADWQELEAWAAVHEVVIVPELDVPGHANQALRRLCPTDPPTGSPVLNPVSERTFAVLTVLIDEILAVFPRTPYVHVGADEVAFDGWEKCRDCAAFLQQRGLSSLEEAYRHFIVRMRDIVHARGRRMIVWEGFAADGAVPIPSDIIVQFFDVEYLRPEQAVALGHEIINSSWGPLYVVPGLATCPLPMVHRWHPGIFGGNALSCVHDALDTAPAFADCVQAGTSYERPLPNRRHPFVRTMPADHPAILGGMMCSWEQLDRDELPALRRHLAVMAERAWNPGHDGSLGDLLLRLEAADWRLGGLLRAVTIADRNRIPDFGACGAKYGPFITELLVAWPRDDGPVDAIATPPADLALASRSFAGDFCDLHPELRERGRGTVWFVHRFDSSLAAPASVLLGYDGPVRVWMNGDQVFTDTAGANPALRDSARIPVRLRPGGNEVVVVLDADGGKAWGIFLRLHDDR